MAEQETIQGDAFDPQAAATKFFANQALLDQYKASRSGGVPSAATTPAAPASQPKVGEKGTDSKGSFTYEMLNGQIVKVRD